jgi:hypothetical protein
MPEPSQKKRNVKQLLLDTAVGLGLLLAVVLIFLVAGGHSLDSHEEPEVVEAIENPQPGPPRPLRLAVTEPMYDDMGKLLVTLGEGYRHETISYEDLMDPEALAGYDVVFLTCHGMPGAWKKPRAPDSNSGETGVSNIKPQMVDAIRTSLTRFVGQGGTLYVSDLHFKLLRIAFPEFVDEAKVAEGRIQTIQALVLDSGLQKRVGNTIELRFDMRAWRPAAFRGREVITYLEGDVMTVKKGRMTVPLLISFPYQKGLVIFTSFHNEAQQTETELELLRHLVFTTVTAREERRIKQTMVRGGVSPKERNLLSASDDGAPRTGAYRCSGAQQLQFVLGFENQGARLRLSVLDPNGTEHKRIGSSTFTLQITNPAPGQWKYTVEPLEVPYSNFPFTLTIGERL